jgi:hypothetical protein
MCPLKVHHFKANILRRELPAFLRPVELLSSNRSIIDMGAGICLTHLHYMLIRDPAMLAFHSQELANLTASPALPIMLGCRLQTKGLSVTCARPGQAGPKSSGCARASDMTRA